MRCQRENTTDGPHVLTRSIWARGASLASLTELLTPRQTIHQLRYVFEECKTRSMVTGYGKKERLGEDDKPNFFSSLYCTFSTWLLSYEGQERLFSVSPPCPSHIPAKPQ